MGVATRAVGRIRCVVGVHDYIPSKFVALNSRVANLVCVRCGRQKPREDAA